MLALGTRRVPPVATRAPGLLLLLMTLLAACAQPAPPQASVTPVALPAASLPPATLAPAMPVATDTRAPTPPPVFPTLTSPTLTATRPVLPTASPPPPSRVPATSTLVPVTEPPPSATATPLASARPVGSEARATSISTSTFTPVVARVRGGPMLGIALDRFEPGQGSEKVPELGAYWVRRGEPLAWEAVEPREGEYHWQALAGLEQELSAQRALGLEPIIEIQHSPEWAQKVPGHPCSAVRQDKFPAFATFVEALLRRYGPGTRFGVRYWQLENEPDVAPEEVEGNAPYGCWGDINDPYYGGRHYGEMLKVVYPRMKAVSGAVQVLMGGLLLECDPYEWTVGPGGCSNENRLKSGYFLEGVLVAGAGRYFDIADVHSYTLWAPKLPSRMHSFYAWSGPAGGTGLPEKVAFVRNVLARYGFDKPIVVGELALKCESRDDVACHDVAAALVPRAYTEAFAANVTAGIYYALVSEWMYKGLLKPDLSPRPAWFAYTALSGRISGAVYVGSVTIYPGVSGGVFRRPDGRPLWILWSTAGPDQVITLPPNTTGVFDRVGQPVAITDNSLTVGWSPVYVDLK